MPKTTETEPAPSETEAPVLIHETVNTQPSEIKPAPAPENGGEQIADNIKADIAAAPIEAQKLVAEGKHFLAVFLARIEALQAHFPDLQHGMEAVAVEAKKVL